MNAFEDFFDVINRGHIIEDSLMRISSGIVDKYVDLGSVFTNDSSSKGTAFAYACETLALGRIQRCHQGG